jgi:hypothetical protein
MNDIFAATRSFVPAVAAIGALIITTFLLKVSLFYF